MNARLIRRRSRKTDDRTSGTFEIPASSRVARRGSTRIDVPSEDVADVPPRSRGSSTHAA
jgi:hypothetical protein